MDRKYMDTHLIVDRYLQGNLADGELAEFEERLVWDEELLDELDLAERLRDGLQESVADNKYSSGHGNNGIVDRLSNVFSVPQYAAAASFLFAVVLTAGTLLNPLVSGVGYQANQGTHTEIVPLLAVRSETPQTIFVNNESWTVLLVDVVGPYESYRVNIRRDEPDPEAIWAQDGLMPTYPDALAIGLPATALAAGRYVISLEGMQDGGTGENSYEHIQDIAFIAALAD